LPKSPELPELPKLTAIYSYENALSEGAQHLGVNSLPSTLYYISQKLEVSVSALFQGIG